MSLMNPARLGVLAAIAAVLMWLSDMLWQPIFTVQLTDSFSIPIWVLLAIYSALQLWYWNSMTEGVGLSDDEVARWGPKLEEATPEIVEQIQAKTPVKDIAARVEASRGIPVDITLRYIIALGQHLDGQSQGTT